MSQKKFYFVTRLLSIILGSVCLFLFILLFVRFFVLSPGVSNGLSMEPTIEDGTFFLVNKVAYTSQDPARFDVVQFINQKEKKLLIKRIIGLPGETVIIKRGAVYIQEGDKGEEWLLEETYLDALEYTTLMAQDKPLVFVLKQGEYFVLGDHRSASTDSRTYGPIRREVIIGRVWLLGGTR